jgi:hypothetical protein
MKLPIIISLTAFVLGAHSQEPEKLTNLRSSWQRARDQATQPLDTKYRTALQQMMDSFTKAGDLNSALAVKSELEKLDPVASGASKPSLLSETPKKIGYRYEFISDACTYDKAVDRAKAAGGVVAFPRNDRDIKEFRELADKAKALQIWLGISREQFAGSKWLCSDGSELGQQFSSQLGAQDGAGFTSVRLQGSALKIHHPSAPLPFIIATPK